MILCVIKHYKEKHPHVSGKELTDQCILELVRNVFPDIDISTVCITRTEKGKPFLHWQTDRQPPSISVSHCEDLFVCAFADDNIGIDIQNRRDIDIDRLSQRYFSKGEQSFIYEAEGDPITRFFTLWTRKEALCKYTGKGLSQVISGESVLDREDVVFDDRMIEERFHLCICAGRKMTGEGYEIQYFDGEQDG